MSPELLYHGTDRLALGEQEGSSRWLPIVLPLWFLQSRCAEARDALWCSQGWNSTTLDASFLHSTTVKSLCGGQVDQLGGIDFNNLINFIISFAAEPSPAKIRDSDSVSAILA